MYPTIEIEWLLYVLKGRSFAYGVQWAISVMFDKALFFFIFLEFIPYFLLHFLESIPYITEEQSWLIG